MMTIRMNKGDGLCEVRGDHECDWERFILEVSLSNDAQKDSSFQTVLFKGKIKSPILGPRPSPRPSRKSLFQLKVKAHVPALTVQAESAAKHRPLSLKLGIYITWIGSLGRQMPW